MSALLLTLGAAVESTRPTGRIVGGWEFVWAAYVLTWTVLVLYAASLWIRRASRPPGEAS